MMRETNGRRHLTQEQLRIMLAGKDAVAEKHIPGSARRQMAHRPYRKKGEDADGRNDKSTPGRVPEL